MRGEVIGGPRYSITGILDPCNHNRSRNANPLTPLAISIVTWFGKPPCVGRSDGISFGRSDAGLQAHVAFFRVLASFSSSSASHGHVEKLLCNMWTVSKWSFMGLL